MSMYSSNTPEILERVSLFFADTPEVDLLFEGRPLGEHLRVIICQLVGLMAVPRGRHPKWDAETIERICPPPVDRGGGRHGAGRSGYNLRRNPGTRQFMKHSLNLMRIGFLKLADGPSQRPRLGIAIVMPDQEIDPFHPQSARQREEGVGFGGRIVDIANQWMADK